MEAAHVPWRPLGELFVSRGLITEAELETALAEQAASGRRLGEILVEHGLVSGPDLTSALMDQLGVEIAKEEGFGSGLWAEIKRRHKRAHQDGSEDEADEREEVDEPPALSLVEDVPADEEPERVPEEPVPVEAELDPFAGEPVPIDPELERELEELRTEYEPPASLEAPLAYEVEHDETARLRLELEQARADLKHLQDMLADSMTALAALTGQTLPQ